MAVYDKRSTAGWNYLNLPIEQLHLYTTSNSIKFDCITKDAIYAFEPLLRVKGEQNRVVGYRFNMEIPILFNNFDSIIPTLEDYFINQETRYKLYLSATNATGQNEWRMFNPALPPYNIYYKIEKGDLRPILRIIINGLLTRDQFKDLFSTGYWKTSQPA